MDEVAEATKWGIVSSVNPQNATARVVFSDRDNTVSYDLPITFANTGFAKIYSMPKVGQPVKCSFLGTGMEDGFIDGSFYNSDKQKKKTGDHLHYIAFDDGAFVEYDAESKIMTLKSGGGVNINGLGIGPDGTLTLKDGTVVDSHYHDQPNDSSGNTEQPTSGPKS